MAHFAKSEYVGGLEDLTNLSMEVTIRDFPGGAEIVLATYKNILLLQIPGLNDLKKLRDHVPEHLHGIGTSQGFDTRDALLETARNHPQAIILACGTPALSELVTNMRRLRAEQRREILTLLSGIDRDMETDGIADAEDLRFCAGHVVLATDRFSLQGLARTLSVKVRGDGAC